MIATTIDYHKLHDWRPKGLYCHGGAENAGPENGGPENVGPNFTRWNLQDWKMQDQY